MYEVYLIISIALCVTGLLALIYFSYYVKLSKPQDYSINQLSQALSTLIIGVFYLYSFCLLHTQEEITPLTLNFTNIMEETIINTTTEPIKEDMFNDVSSHLVHNPQLFLTTSVSTINENITKGISEVQKVVQQHKQNQTLGTTFVNKHDLLFQKYQTLLKDILTKKGVNKSNVPAKNKFRKKGRDLLSDYTYFDVLNRNCFQKIFLHFAMFLYSFIQCAMMLIINVNGSSGEILMEKSAIKDDLKAEDVDEVSTSKDEIPSKESQVQNLDGPSLDESKCGTKVLLMQTFTFLTLPVILIVILYHLIDMRIEFPLTALETNFSATQPDVNMFSFLENPLNVTNVENTREVDAIVKSVYSIVDNLNRQNNVTHHQPFYEPLKFDILLYLNRNKRTLKDFMKKCGDYSLGFKIYCAFVFILAFFGTLLYANSVNTKLSSRGFKNAKMVSLSILTFGMMWFPVLVDLFSRLYLSEQKPTLVTNLLLLLGNICLILFNLNNYREVKTYLKKFTFVNP